MRNRALSSISSTWSAIRRLLLRTLEPLQCRKRPLAYQICTNSLKGPTQALPSALSLCISRGYLTYTSLHTKEQFSMANPPNLHIFGLREETGVPRGNPYSHREKVHKNIRNRSRSRPSSPSSLLRHSIRSWLI